MHTQLDLKTQIPTFIAITSGKTYELSVLDRLVLEPGAFYVMDRGYLDYGRLYRINQAKSFFVIRAKKDIKYRRVYSRVVDRTSGLRVDQTIRLTYEKARKTYPDQLRLVRFFDEKTRKRFIFLTNNFELSPSTITMMYRSRWDIELFFRWIKQHLRIKSFYGLSENAVHIQLWISICTYVLVVIARKQLNLNHISLYTVLQILSISIVDKKPILHAFHASNYTHEDVEESNQLNLWSLPIGQ
jgi:IS4 transposase